MFDERAQFCHRVDLGSEFSSLRNGPVPVPIPRPHPLNILRDIIPQEGIEMSAFKQTFVAGIFLVAAGAGSSAFAQSYPDSRYSQSYPDSRYSQSYPDSRYSQSYPDSRYSQSYSRPQDIERAERNHEGAERHDLKHHQQAERYQYGSDSALRAHQKEERHRLKHEQQYERHTGESIHDRYGDR